MTAFASLLVGRRWKGVFRAALVIAPVILWCGCSKDSNPAGPAGPSIVLGTTRQIASETIGSGGGSVVVDLPGDPLDGLSILVDAGAYSDTRTFAVASTPITSHTFGADFHPLTPLIRISNGGGLAAHPMEIFIPVTIPAGKFAMPFLYDRTTGRLEGLPVISYDADGITIATRHLDNARLLSGFAKEGGIFARTDDRAAEIVVSDIDESRLTQDTYETGFKPGTDDFVFANYGSWLAPRGHCAGQCLAMMWYYNRQKPSGGALRQRLDNDRGSFRTPAIWQDDVGAYRFCSMLQHDLDWTSLSNGLVQLTQRMTPGDIVTMKLFKYAILLTGSPQFISMTATVGGADVGHAMLVYRIAQRSMFVVDPNRPGNSNIEAYLSGSAFQPLNASVSAANQSTYNFANFRYSGASALISTDKIGQRWSELLAKTIGDGTFPQYTIKIMNDNGDFVPLTDGCTVENGDVSLIMTGTTEHLKIAAMDANGQWKPDGTHFSLSGGSHMIGVHVTDDSNRYVDFRWVNIHAGATQNEFIRWTVDGDSVKGAPAISYLALDTNGAKTAQLALRSLDPKGSYEMLLFFGYHPTAATYTGPPQDLTVQSSSELYGTLEIIPTGGSLDRYVTARARSCTAAFTRVTYDYTSKSGVAEGTLECTCASWPLLDSTPDYGRTHTVKAAFRLHVIGP